MSTTTESAPCWKLVHPDGKDYDQGDGVPHYSTEHDAQTEANEFEPSLAPTPQKFTAPCVTMSCDECEVDLGGDDVFTQVHCEGGIAQAHEIARTSDWKVTPDGRTYCWDCPVPEVEKVDQSA